MKSLYNDLLVAKGSKVNCFIGKLSAATTLSSILIDKENQGVRQGCIKVDQSVEQKIGSHLPKQVAPVWFSFNQQTLVSRRRRRRRHSAAPVDRRRLFSDAAAGQGPLRRRCRRSSRSTTQSFAVRRLKLPEKSSTLLSVTLKNPFAKIDWISPRLFLKFSGINKICSTSLNCQSISLSGAFGLPKLRT